MTKQKYIVISNGTALTPSEEIKDGIVVIEGDKIVDVGKRGEIAEPADAERIDAEGNYITPGLIDIHVHGSNGADVLDATAESLEVMSKFFASRGVTGFVATALTCPQEEFLAVLDCVRSVKKNGGLSGAEVLGVHIEGPFLNMEQKGCHRPDLITNPSPEKYKPYIEYADVVKMMTLAPELDGAVKLVEDLCSAGIVAAAGHSNGIMRELMPAIDAGISHVVHFFCNMSHFRRDNLKRVAGAMETFLYDDRLTTELIGDGWHIGDTIMKLVVKVKGIEKVCFVTDAMVAAGMPDGMYTIGGIEAVVENGIARLPDNTAYASSVTTLDTCVRNGINRMGLSIKDAVRMASLTPASVIRVDKTKGSIEKGKDADIVVMDGQANVQLTIAGGKEVYKK